MNEIVSRLRGGLEGQGQTSQDHSPDLGDAHTAWNHLDSLKWARMVAYGPNLPYLAGTEGHIGPPLECRTYAFTTGHAAISVLRSTGV